MLRNQGQRRATQRPFRPPRREQAGRPAPRLPAQPWSRSDFAVEAVEAKTRFHYFDSAGQPDAGHSGAGFSSYCTPIKGQVLGSTTQGPGFAIAGLRQARGKDRCFSDFHITQLWKHRRQIERFMRRGPVRLIIRRLPAKLVMQIANDAVESDKHCPLNVMGLWSGRHGFSTSRIKTAEKQPLDILGSHPGPPAGLLQPLVEVHLDLDRSADSR